MLTMFIYKYIFVYYFFANLKNQPISSMIIFVIQYDYTYFDT